MTDKQQYVYRALKNGTLSNPFRLIKAGETLVFDEPYKASWLVSEEEYQKFRNRNITPQIAAVSGPKKKQSHMVKAEGRYSESVKKMDEVFGVKAGGQKAKDEGKEDAPKPKKGTGNKEVI